MANKDVYNAHKSVVIVTNSDVFSALFSLNKILVEYVNMVGCHVNHT